MDSNTSKEESKKIFQLYHTTKILPGKSSIEIGKPTKNVYTLTPKFYQIVDFVPDQSEITKYQNLLKQKGPTEKYVRPMTENQRCGWVWKPLLNINRADRRLCHHKITSDMVKKYLMAYSDKTRSL